MREIIEAFIEKATGNAGAKVVVPERPELGDYSTNAPFVWTKQLKMAPLDIAKSAAEKIRQADTEGLFTKVEAAPPGFLNFWVSPSAIAKEVERLVKAKKLAEPVSQPKKINIEFISANPTGPMTMANGRGGFLGDVLANVLEAAGHKVTREYYINDAGNQIKTLGESILAALGQLPAKEEHYQGDYVKKIAKELAKKIKPKASSEEIGRLAADILLTQIKQSAKNVGISFDVWFSEFKKLRGPKGLVLMLLAMLEQKGLVATHEGAKWLKSGDDGDEKDRVLVKSDGQPTYFLSDIAYHYDKLVLRKFDLAIDIWGADHHGYVARLKGGVKALQMNPERLQIIITQLVRLVENGKEVKMSKRAGEFITLDELIQEVGKDSARFFFLMHSPDTHMDFDMGLAKEKSNKNPVYYVQYAYVRCLSILEKAKAKSTMKLQLTGLKSEAELGLMKELIQLPDIIQQTAEDYQVSRLTRYATDLARALHNFYEKERVIGVEPEMMKSRLSLVMAAKTILEKLFGVIGIAAPKKM